MTQNPFSNTKKLSQKAIATNIGQIGQIVNIGHGPRARPSREEFRICSRSDGDF